MNRCSICGLPMCSGDICKRCKKKIKAFRLILENHLVDVGTLEDMQSVYIIPECAIDRIVKELMKEIHKEV